MIRKTKIIATIGPSTSERKVLKKIIEKAQFMLNVGLVRKLFPKHSALELEMVYI